MTSKRGLEVDVDRGRSRSPPASGGLAAAVDATPAGSVASSSDGGDAVLDAGLSSEGRASPDVDSQ